MFFTYRQTTAVILSLFIKRLLFYSFSENSKIKKIDEHTKFTLFIFLRKSRDCLFFTAVKLRLNHASCSKFNSIQLRDSSQRSNSKGYVLINPDQLFKVKFILEIQIWSTRVGSSEIFTFLTIWGLLSNKQDKTVQLSLVALFFGDRRSRVFHFLYGAMHTSIIFDSAIYLQLWIMIGRNLF